MNKIVLFKIKSTISSSIRSISVSIKTLISYKKYFIFYPEQIVQSLLEDEAIFAVILFIYFFFTKYLYLCCYVLLFVLLLVSLCCY